MSIHNSLVLAVLSILKSTTDSLSLYDLMKLLEKLDYSLIDTNLSVSNELLMFRKNFVLMNALYQIQRDIHSSGYYLYISSLKIQLLPISQSDDNSLQGISTDTLKTDKALSQFYLDWSNYDVDQSEVDDLLKGFWTRYIELNQASDFTDKRLAALQLLELESSSSWENIQQAYRRMVTKYHPDKGGESSRFIDIREAYLVLKYTRNN